MCGIASHGRNGRELVGVGWSCHGDAVLTWEGEEAE
jgi:hypothetical protein